MDKMKQEMYSVDDQQDTVGLNHYAKQEVHAVILANGEYPRHASTLFVLQNAPYVVCCDGAANQYIAEGFQPDAIVGDGDSVSAAIRERHKAIFHHYPDQYCNDQTKALTFLLQQGKKKIAIVGACGKREDHTIANIALLMHYFTQGHCVIMFSNHGVFLPASDNTTFISYPGQQVSIFNFAATQLSSCGLVYPIYDFQHWYQGTLNEACADNFSIKGKGNYLVFLNY